MDKNPNTRTTTALQSAARGIAATIVVSASALAMSQPAMADDRYELAYTPAQISTDVGMQALQEKINNVARAACPTYNEARSLQQVGQCRAEVKRDLITKINVPAFTAFVEESQSRRPADFVASVSGR